MAKTNVMKDKEVKHVNVKPLIPSKRLSLTRDELTDDLRRPPLKGRVKSGSIHDILEKMAESQTSQDERWLSAKQIYDEFCSETSFTALTRIHKAKHVYKRIAWTVIAFSMITWMSIQCYWLSVKYFSYPIEVKTEVTSASKLEFPSITICNLNPLKRSKMYEGPFSSITEHLELDDSDILYDKYISDLKQTLEDNNSTNDVNNSYFLNAFMQSQQYNKWNVLENDTDVAELLYSKLDSGVMAMLSYSNVAVQIADEEIKQYGHQANNLIMSCTWKGKGCSPANFTYVRNNKYGNCYMWNSIDNGMKLLTSTDAGPIMGLTLELNIEQDEYVPSLSNDAGVRVMIHARGTYPFPEDDGISINPGFKTSIGITQTQITRLPPPHADCGNHGINVENLYTTLFGTEYSKQTCLKSCYQETLLGKCGCVFSLYQRPTGASVCSYDANFTYCFEHECTTTLDECSGKCPSPCKETQYDLTISMSKWPSEQYANHLSSRIKKSTSDFLNANRLETSEDTLAKVDIFFRDMIYEKVEQRKAYESQNLISDIGGQLGLWLGLSAITIGELIEFIASICQLAAVRCIRRDHLDPDPAMKKVSPMEA